MAADSEGPKAHISESVDASQALAVSGKALSGNCNSARPAFFKLRMVRFWVKEKGWCF